MSWNAKPCTMNVKRGRKARASSESIHAQKTWLNMEVMQSEAEEQDSIPAVGKTPSTEPGLLDSLDMNLQPDEGLRKRLATAAATKTAGKAAAIVLKWSTRSGVDKAVRVAVPVVGRVAAWLA